MIELLKEEMYCIAPLCQCRKEDVILWSCVEGNMGRVFVNKRNNPTFAMALVADFCFLLGSKNDIDESIYYKVLEEGWKADFCYNFIYLEDYLKNGIGYIIMHNGEIISGAGAYSKEKML